MKFYYDATVIVNGGVLSSKRYFISTHKSTIGLNQGISNLFDLFNNYTLSKERSEMTMKEYEKYHITSTRQIRSHEMMNKELMRHGHLNVDKLKKKICMEGMIQML